MLKINHLIIAVLFCLISANLLLAQSPPIPGNWQLTFEENFNGNNLDPSKWRVGQHWLGFNGIVESGNSANQITIRNGNAEIKAERKPLRYIGKSCDYATSEITTFQSFRQKYGYFEARIKYDAVRGSWPAFWTMPDRGIYGADSVTFESYIKFDISSYKDPVSSVMLKIKVTNISNPHDTSDVSIHRLLSNNWNENDITWNNKPSFDPVWFSLFTCTDDSNRVSEFFEDEFIIVDVTDYINTQILANKNVGFAIVDMFMQNEQIRFGSKEATAENDRPHLVIDGDNLYPTDDAFVKGGCEFSNINFGKETELIVQDAVGYTADINNNGMEIDIMESLGIWGDNKTQHALHWDYYGEGHPHTGTKIIEFDSTSDGYHVYAMDWQEGHIDFYVDGVKTWEYDNVRVGSVESYMLLSHQLGGWNGNDNIDDANLPATMFIDYVRVYEKVITKK